MSSPGRHPGSRAGIVLMTTILVGCGGSPPTSSPAAASAVAASAAAAIAPCDAPPGVSTSVSFTIDGAPRSALVHAPKDGSGSKPMPLVLALHGYGGFGMEMELTSQLSEASDEHGWLVVYPEGTGTPEAWQDDPGGLGHQADISFLREVITDVVDGGCGDPKHVIVTGISQGGWLSDMAGCEMTDVVGGVVAVAGRDMGWACKPAAPIPFVAVNGVLDQVLPYEGGPVNVAAPVTQVDGVDDWLSARAQSRGCHGQPAESSASAHVRLRVWPGCRAPVSLYRVEDGGHTWPNGGGQDPPVDHELSVDAILAGLFAAM